ncbi:ABC transporter G family protein [Cavenderia fasciculata]|uniref:ABC transporter G family protein n=1 Tax=Cavenderia fasciculata TaxID=261658 RepID=F4Q036_CACFS|nr:ABC transporter G family protein [Cavenderia fasciculata]EGG18950.1 ABC transporter G family protein [Cavenderia fasciculata]|eukprot:XP_004357412.1 ABC transporter G family protein [Cavenderia fasciculata]
MNELSVNDRVHWSMMILGISDPPKHNNHVKTSLWCCDPLFFNNQFKLIYRSSTINQMTTIPIELEETSNHQISDLKSRLDGQQFKNRVDFTIKGLNHYVSTKEKRDGKGKGSKTNIAGEMIGILGPSGAGKTTLLDIVAHRLPINGSGKLLLNGTSTPYNVFKKLSGYVTQSDTLSPAMTVFETLSFYAQLKMPREMSYDDKIKKVNEVLAEMGLKRCKDTLVGDDKIRGISGGERRRVTIAIELLTGPSILFVDEPTSGLDSNTSLSVMRAIRKLANSGRTIICTIHQPRSNIYNLFDKLLLLGDGSTIYYGETQLALDYFKNLGFYCDPSTNPADFFLDLINTQVEDDMEDLSVTMENNEKITKKLTPDEMIRLKKEFKEGPTNIQLKEKLDNIEIQSEKKELSYESRQGASWMTQYRLLFHRETLNMRRNPMASRIQVTNSIFQGVGQTSIQSRTGVLAFLIMGLSFPAVMMTIQVFPLVVNLFLKDRASGVYGTLPFFLAKSTADVLLAVLTPVIMGTIIEPFYAAGPYFRFILILIEFTEGDSFGYHFFK